jgi:hypothetical protein
VASRADAAAGRVDSAARETDGVVARVAA